MKVPLAYVTLSVLFSCAPDDLAGDAGDGGQPDSDSGDAHTDGDVPGRDCTRATMVHRGNLEIETDEELSALHDLAGVTGDLIIRNVTAATLSADCLVTVGGQLVVDRVLGANLSFPSLTSIGGGLRPSYNEALTSISMPALTTIAGSLDLHVNRALTSVELPALREVGGDVVLLHNSALPSFSLPALETVRFENVTSMPPGDGVTVYRSSALTSLSFPALTTMGGTYFGISDCPALTSISVSEITEMDWIRLSGLPALNELSMPRLATLHGGLILQSVALTHLSLPMLANPGDLALQSAALTELSMPNIESLGSLGITDCDDMTLLSLPALTMVVGSLAVEDNAVLDEVVFPRFTSLGGLWFQMRNNPALAQCLVDASLAELQTAGFAGNADVTNNRAGCTCAKVDDVWRGTCP